jgi:hypothetical protein
MNDRSQKHLADIIRRANDPVYAAYAIVQAATGLKREFAEARKRVEDNKARHGGFYEAED